LPLPDDSFERRAGRQIQPDTKSVPDSDGKPQAHSDPESRAKSNPNRHAGNLSYTDYRSQPHGHGGSYEFTLPSSSRLLAFILYSHNT
jgi:hypothetical protein